MKFRDTNSEPGDVNEKIDARSPGLHDKPSCKPFDIHLSSVSVVALVFLRRHVSRLWRIGGSDDFPHDSDVCCFLACDQCKHSCNRSSVSTILKQVILTSIYLHREIGLKCRIVCFASSLRHEQLEFRIGHTCFAISKVYHHVLPFDSGSAFPLTSNPAKKDTGQGRIGGGGRLAYLRPQFHVLADLVPSYLYCYSAAVNGATNL